MPFRKRHFKPIANIGHKIILIFQYLVTLTVGFLDQIPNTALFKGTIDTEPGACLDGRVALDQLWLVTTPAYPGETFEANVTVRAPKINLDMCSFDLRAEIKTLTSALSAVF